MGEEIPPLKSTLNICPSIFAAQTLGSGSITFKYNCHLGAGEIFGRIPVLIIIGGQTSGCAVIPVTFKNNSSVSPPSAYPTGYNNAAVSGNTFTMTTPNSLWSIFYVIYDRNRIDIFS